MNRVHTIVTHVQSHVKAAPKQLQIALLVLQEVTSLTYLAMDVLIHALSDMLQLDFNAKNALLLVVPALILLIFALPAIQLVAQSTVLLTNAIALVQMELNQTY